MDLFLSILKSVIYGVIEGITEWLPISSTGHMILAEQVLKFGYTEDFMEMFRVVIQLGAILAVVVLYFHKLWPFCKDNGRDTGFAAHLRWPVVRLWFKIIAACVPAAVLGILLDDWMDAHLYNSVVVALMLIVYGVAFILIERRPRVPTTTKLSRITYPQAFKVGCWQVLSLIPGTSRSGSTILGGMLCGMSRPAAFIVSIIAIRFLMDYVKRHTFTAFGVYRIALGIVVLVIWGVQTFVLKAPATV